MWLHKTVETFQKRTNRSTNVMPIYGRPHYNDVSLLHFDKDFVELVAVKGLSIEVYTIICKHNGFILLSFKQYLRKFGSIAISIRTAVNEKDFFVCIIGLLFLFFELLLWQFAPHITKRKAAADVNKYLIVRIVNAIKGYH